MRSILTLDINGTRRIEMLVDSIDEIIYYFDKVIVNYKVNNRNYVIFEDFACEGLRALHGALSSAISGNREFSEKYLFEKGAGYYYNLFDNDIVNLGIKKERHNFEILEMYGWTDNRTWIYTHKGAIYIEVSPYYRWLGVAPDKDDKFIPFDAFMNTYAPFDITTIEQKDALCLLSNCDKLMQCMAVWRPE